MVNASDEHMYAQAKRKKKKKKVGQTAPGGFHMLPQYRLLFPSLGAGETFRNGMTFLLSVSVTEVMAQVPLHLAALGVSQCTLHEHFGLLCRGLQVSPCNLDTEK